MWITANQAQRHRQRQVAGLFASVALLTAALPALAIEPRLETRSLYLNVEKDGMLLSGLGQDNFRLYINGQPQPFRLEKPEEPASIALLVEYSNSSWYFFDDLGACIQGFLKHATEGHWYALATYAQTLEVNVDFTSQIGAIPEAYFALGQPMWNEINTYDAVYEMLDKMGRLPGRRILIVIGSGLDTFSSHHLDQVKEKVEAENVTIFVAGLGSLLRTSYDASLGTPARMDLLRAQAFLQMLAAKSGGFAWFPNHFAGFPDVMEGIIQSIATQYRLVCDAAPPRPGKFQKVKVEASGVLKGKRENFKVLVREGWR